MYDLLLANVRDHVSRDNRNGALKLLRTAVQDGTMRPRDGVELMLAVRRGSQDAVMDAIQLLRRGASGAYRFVPKTDHAFA